MKRNSKPKGKDNPADSNTVSNLLTSLNKQAEKTDWYKLKVVDIQIFSGVSYYATETNSKLPIVLKAPQYSYCIDGQQYIEEAEQNGKEEILCEIIEVAETSESDLAIRVIASRIETRGGSASFVEMLRAINQLIHFLLSSNENLLLLSHGGRRKGEAFSNNRGNDVITVISQRLNQHRDLISEYTTYGRYLTDEVLKTAIEERKSKKFFVGIQAKKRKKVADLQREGFSKDEITNEISTFVLRQIFPSRQEVNEEEQPNECNGNSEDLEIEDIQTENDEIEIHEMTEFEKLQQDMKNEAANLFQFLNSNELNKDIVAPEFEDVLDKLNKLCENYRSIVADNELILMREAV
ncbi:hypothetical protein ACFL7D_07785 [candidate division KSB1 bacterium]